MPLTDSSDALSQPLFWSKARRHLLGADPVLAKIMERCGPEQLVPRNDAFFSLARSIVGQQISVKAAQSIWDRLVKELGGMTVRKVAAANQERLRSCGITRQKSGYLLDLAEHFQDGKLYRHGKVGIAPQTQTARDGRTQGARTQELVRSEKGYVL